MIKDLGIDVSITDSPDYFLADEVLRQNRSHASLDGLRQQAKEPPEDGYQLVKDLLLHQGKLVVANVDQHRRKLIQEIHAQVSSAHPGIGKTRQQLASRYYWRGLFEDVKRYVDKCHSCKQAHHRRDKTPGLYHPLSIPDHPWQHICCDFKSFPVDDLGYDTICVFVDRLSKTAVSIPCHKIITAKGMAELYHERVCCYYGLPDSIVSDKGPQFVSTLWKSLCSILGVKVKLSTADSPQTDGQSENLNQYIDQRLRLLTTTKRTGHECYWLSITPNSPCLTTQSARLPSLSLAVTTRASLSTGLPRKCRKMLEKS